MVKDENEYLEEWIDYHLLLGVERFYIYDNESQVPVRENLADYIGRGQVVIQEISGQGQQLRAYDHCIQTFGRHSKWIGFIDTDEFIVPSATSDLRDFLQDYENFGGLAVHWVMFGSNGHMKKPNGGMLANYTRRTIHTFPENRRIKSIIQPDKVLIPFSPHHFIYKPGYMCVNENGLRIDDQVYPPSTQKIRINHYWLRSKEEFNAKLSRGRGDRGTPYSEDLFTNINSQSTLVDLSVLDLLGSAGVLDISLITSRVSDESQDTRVDLPDQLHRRALELPASITQINAGQTQVPEPRGELLELLSMDGLVQAAQEGHDQEKLEQYYRVMINRYPNFLIFYCDLADLYMSMNQPDKAWNTLAAAWRLAPDTYYVLIRMGKFYQAVGDLDHAEKVYRLALAIDPDGFKTLCYLASIQIDRNKIDQAIGLVAHAVQKYPYSTKDPDVLKAIKKLGVYYYELQDWQQALSLFLLALEYNPEDCELLVNIGKIYYDRREFAQVEHYLTRAVKARPEDEEARLGLALVQKSIQPVGVRQI